METENNLELDDNEDTKYQNLYDVIKVILQWKFEAFNVYISNEGSLKIGKSNAQLKLK